MQKRFRIVQHIYEGRESEPTLTHVFYGETAEHARRIFDAHLQTDAFMRACQVDGRFHGFACSCNNMLEELGEDGEWSQIG